MWSLAQGSPASVNPAPLVTRVTAAQNDTGPVSLYRLDLDAPLDDVSAYLLSLSALARSWGGQAVDVTPLAFTSARTGVQPATTRRQWGDVALPIVGDGAGDLVLLTPEASLKAELLLMVSTYKGSFRFDSTRDLGLGLLPKRNVTVAQLNQAAGDLQSQFAAHTQVRRARVYGRFDVAHVVVLDCSVDPVFAAQPLQFSAPLTTGEKGSK